jgi:hypothetical protein
MVDAADSKSVVGDNVLVQVRPGAPSDQRANLCVGNGGHWVPAAALCDSARLLSVRSFRARDVRPQVISYVPYALIVGRSPPGRASLMATAPRVSRPSLTLGGCGCGSRSSQQGCRSKEVKDLCRQLPIRTARLAYPWERARCSRGSQQPARIADQSLWQSEAEDLASAHEPVGAVRTG